MEERFLKALHAVVAEMEARTDVTGILFFGSASRDEATPASDLDLYAITNGNQFWISGRFVEGVEVELHVAPAKVWRQRLENRSPILTNAFATGKILLDRTKETAELVEIGKRYWSEGPNELTSSQVDSYRYRVSDLVRDLEDVPEHSPEARLLGGLLVPLTLEAYCALHRVWPVKSRRWIEYVSTLAPQLGRQVQEYYERGQPAKLAIAIADAVLEPFGGRIFEYEAHRRSC